MGLGRNICVEKEDADLNSRLSKDVNSSTIINLEKFIDFQSIKTEKDSILERFKDNQK